MKYILLGMLLFTSCAWAQSEPTTEPTLSFQSAAEVVQHLRTHYGIKKSVYLTQVTHKLSTSFGSGEQLSQQWQSALEASIEEPQQFTQINSHALMAQSLIQYSNGMTLNRWRQVKLPPILQLPALDQTTDLFQHWLNLHTHWQQIIVRHGDNLQKWHPWFVEGFVADVPAATTVDEIQSVLLLINNSEAKETLDTNALNEIRTTFNAFATALLRQLHHQQSAQTLAFAFDWIEIYQLLELSPSLLSAEQQSELAKTLIQAQAYWQAQETKIQSTNQQLFALINDIFVTLPNKFKNPDHWNATLNNRIFSLITGIKNPGAYFNHPLRQEIQENLEVCLNLSVLQAPEPPLPITDSQFQSCLNDFISWASDVSNSADLAGNLIKLDNAASINRAIESPAVQITNNLIAQAAGPIECQQQLSAQHNWVEWALAAETIAWFSDRWPGLMVTQNLSELMQPVIDSGKSTFNKPTCIQNTTPLLNQFNVVKSKWELLKQEVMAHVDQFKTTALTANSDVDLFQSTDQKTNYVPENLTISACDVTNACGAYINLEPDSELLQLFPNHLKLAEQFGLGELAVCYENVHWVNRKTAPTHLDNNKIANFEGQLALQLSGKYNGEAVFTKQLISQQSHIYLFGENNETVLNTECPLSLVGTQINTTLDRGTFGLLPNRLTFLTASKIDINAVIRSNWTHWLDQLGSQTPDFVFFDEMNEVKTALNNAFLQNVNALQQEIYRKLIANNQSRSNDSALSKAAFEFTAHRNLLDSMVTGLYPTQLMSDQDLHAAIHGATKLIDMDFFRQAFQSQLNVVDMLQRGDESFLKHANSWVTGTEQVPIIHNTLAKINQLIQTLPADRKKEVVP